MTTAPSASQMMENLARETKDARLSLSDIFMNVDNNTRVDYDDEELGNLQASIEAVGGILTPLQVIEVEPGDATENKSYALVAGFRRYLALENLSKDEPSFAHDVPVRVVSPGTEAGMTITQLIENLQRADLSSLEKALGIKRIFEDKESNLSQKEAARLLGISVSAVSQHLKLLELPQSIQDMLKSGDITFSHCRIIMYQVPEDQWIEAAKMAKSMIYAEFVKKIEERYGKKEPKEGDATATETESAEQRGTQLRRAAKITKIYMPFFKDELKKAVDAKDDAAAKAWQLRLDTVNWVLNEKSELDALCKPFEEKLEADAVAEKAAKDAESKKSHYMKARISQLRELVKAMPKPGETKNTLAQDMAIVRGTVEEDIKKAAADSPEGKAFAAELGFELKDADAFFKDFTNAWQEAEKKRVEDAQKRADEKKKKEEEAKKAEAAAGKGDTAKAGEAVAAK